MSVPKRHHYVPQMILSGFTDPDGWLYWCRHREDAGTVRRARPAELFHKNHLYSTLSESGIKDTTMEGALAVLESEAVGVVRAILYRKNPNEIKGKWRSGSPPYYLPDAYGFILNSLVKPHVMCPLWLLTVRMCSVAFP